MFKLFKVTVLFLLLISFLPIAYSQIQGSVDNVLSVNGKDIISTDFDDGKVISEFSNDKKIIADINRDGIFSIDTSTIYCWEGCNIYPKIYLKQIDITEGGEVLTRAFLPYSNEEAKEDVILTLDVFRKEKVKNMDPVPLISSIDNSKSISLEISDDLIGKTYAAYWNGVLLIPSSTVYQFFIDVSGPVKVWLDDTNIFYEDEANFDNHSISFDYYIGEGQHNFSIEYVNSVNFSNPNIYWSHESVEQELIPDANLIFHSGGSQDIMPVATRFLLFSLEDIGLSDIYPVGLAWSKSYDKNKRPILLVHGWSNENLSSDQNNTRTQWGDVPTFLKDKGHTVWELVYNPANLDNRKNAGMFSTKVQKILSNFHPDFPNLDVVSHSMGGMVVRGYIQNLGISQDGSPIYYRGDIRKYVIIASPMFGSYFANLVNDRYNFNRICDWINKSFNLNVISEATYNMEKGSQYTWDLNYQPPNLDVEYLTIGGFKDFAFFGLRICFANLYEYDDGVVSLRSANLLRYNVSFITLDQNHLDIPKTEQTANIIDSFIKGENTSKIKSYLKDGEYYMDPDDPNADPNPYTVGDLLIKFRSFGGIKSVALKAPSRYYNLTKNNRTGIWYYLYFEDANHFTTSVLTGTYDVLVNEGGGLVDTNYDIEIRASETTLLEVIKDSDQDGVGDEEDACPTLYGTWCHGCQQPTCGFCAEARCPSPPSVAPFCVASDSSRLCNSNYACSYDQGDNYYNIGGEYSCQGFCDGNYNCDYANNCSYSESCDPDDDNDGIIDKVDNCQKIANPNQEDLDGDGLGDVCDSDVDGDGYNFSIDCNDTNYFIHPESTEICGNGVDEDCDGLDKPCCVINSPIKTNYSEERINFNITLLQVSRYLKYIDYDKTRPTATTLCSRCNEYGNTSSRYKTFSDGYHTISIFTNDGLCNKTIHFFVDSTKPRVNKQEPKNKGYCNGTFNVRYTEEYLKNVYLYYGDSMAVDNDCPSGRNQECSFDVEITQYENQTIPFHFEVEDLFWKVPYRTNYICLVDTIPPHITHLNWSISGSYLYLNISLDDKAKYLKYIDYNSRSGERSLCSGCNEYGASRTRRLLFKRGNHNVSIIAVDEVGNRETKGGIKFTV